MRIITLVEYRETWPGDYRNEALMLQNTLHDNFLRVFHIGSTAIVGMKAKPIIDILIEVKSLSNVDDKTSELENIHYQAMDEY